MNGTVDSGRAAVYAAEIAAFEGTSYESIVEFSELTRLAAVVTGSQWWPGGDVVISNARADAGSSTTNQRGNDTPVIRLAAPQMTRATLVHELAHVLAGIGAGHGAIFRRAHLDITGQAFGEFERLWLADTYAAFGLTPGERRWPAPPSPSIAV